MHAFFADFAHCAQAPNLKPTRIGEDGLVPFFKSVQPAELAQHVQARTHPQVKGVTQNDLRAHLIQAARHHALDGSVGAHRHENRRLHHPVVQRHAPPAGVAAQIAAVGAGQVMGKNIELQHAGILGGPVDECGQFTLCFALLLIK